MYAYTTLFLRASKGHCPLIHSFCTYTSLFFSFSFFFLKKKWDRESSLLFFTLAAVPVPGKKVEVPEALNEQIRSRQRERGKKQQQCINKFNRDRQATGHAPSEIILQFFDSTC